MTRYLGGGEAQDTFILTLSGNLKNNWGHVLPPAPLLGSPCGPQGRMLKLRIDRNIRALPRPPLGWGNIMNARNMCVTI